MLDLRPFTLASVLAAAGFAVEGVIAVVHPVGDSNWDATAQVLNAAFGIAVLALALALPYVGRWLRVGRPGRIGVIACQVGAVLMAIESVDSGAHGGNTLGGLFFGGVLLVLVGLLVLAIDGVRAGAVRWAAPLPVIGWLVAIGGGDVGGGIVLAVILLVVAVSVMRDRTGRTTAGRATTPPVAG